MRLSPTSKTPVLPKPEKQELARVPYADVRGISLAIFRAWARRHVDLASQVTIVDAPSFGCYDVTGPCRAVSQVESMVASIKAKGWP